MADYTLASTSHGNRLSRRGLPFVADVRPMAASAVGVNGCLMAVNSSGLAFGTTITVAGGAVAIAGVCRIDVDNSSGAASAKNAEIEAGDIWLDNDSTNPITQAMIGVSYCYAVDNHTVGSSDVGGTLVLVGVPTELGAAANGNYGKVAVKIAGVTPYAATSGAANAAFKVRGVALNLEAGSFSAGGFTATANGALATQDGLTIAAGDVLMLPAGTLTTLSVSAANSGPYVVSSVGSASSKVTLARPSWWPHGGAIPAGQIISVAAGTLFGGSSFKAICDTGLVIGTGTPGLWANYVSTQVTFSSGTTTAITSIPIRSAAKSVIHICNTGTAAHSSTRVWRATSITAGALGTATFTPVAESAPGTTNASDVGVYTIAVQNW